MVRTGVDDCGRGGQERPLSAHLAEKEACMAEARALSRLLAAHGERGFETLAPPSTPQRSFEGVSVFEETLWRLGFVGDHESVPVRTRKWASHCGGVPPCPPQLMAFKDTPKVADPMNFVQPSGCFRFGLRVYV